MLSVKKSKLKKVLIVIIIAILLFSAVSFTATKLIYDSVFPRYDCAVSDYPIALESTVSSREKVSYPSGENLLSGYLYKSKAQNSKDTLIVLAHGHNACSDDYLWQIHELLELGWSVFAFDATGTCNSQGDSTVGFSQELCDLKSTLDYIESCDRFCYNNIALLGHSCGGYAVCCALAYDYDISAVISVSGINSAMEGIIGASANYIGPFAYGNYGFLWLYQTMLFGAETVNLRADKILSNSDVPVLLIHGQNDEEVPADKYSIISHKDEISGKNTEYFIRSAPYNSGHTNILFSEDGTADDQVIGKINEFLEKNIK